MPQYSLVLNISRDNASSDTYNYRIEVIYRCVEILARKMGEKVYDLTKKYDDESNMWSIYDRGPPPSGGGGNKRCMVMPTVLNDWLGPSIDKCFHEGRSIQDVANWLTEVVKLADVKKSCNDALNQLI